MKKILSLMLALVMVLSLAACGGSGGSNDSNSSGKLDVDMSKYPSAIGEWTGQNFMDYFTEAGAVAGGLNFETWMQPHEMYWDDSPVSECVGWWDDEGTNVMIFILSPDMADSSQEEYDEWMASLRETKSFPGEWEAFPMDHMIGNVVFSYETSILDDGIYEKMSAAYENLAAALGVTPDF